MLGTKMKHLLRLPLRRSGTKLIFGQKLPIFLELTGLIKSSNNTSVNRIQQLAFQVQFSFYIILVLRIFFY